MSNHDNNSDLALVGTGYWGKNLARNFHALGALHTLCDRSQGSLDGFGADYGSVEKTTSFEAVIGDPRITKVAIAAPAVLHYELARAALLAGKDVYVEKPLCLNMAEAEKLVALAEQTGRILMVGHLLQYHPCVVRLRQIIREGQLGKLQYITSNRLNLGKIRSEENALWSFAPHDISVILSLVGDHLPEQIRCQGESYLTKGVPDTTLTTMRFADGVRAHVYVSWLNPFKEQKLTVVGSRGMAVFDDTKPWREKLVLHRDYLTWTDGLTPTPRKAEVQAVVPGEQEPLEAECRHFLECCRERKLPRTDGREGARVLQVLNAAQASLDQDGEAVLCSTAGVRSYFAHSSTVIHPQASIGPGCRIWHFSHIMAGAEIGANCSLGQNVVVSPDVRLGRNVKVQNNVSIYTGTTIEDDVFLGPSCVLTNVSNPRSQVNRQKLYEKTLLRRGATVGANATVVCGVTLGQYCFIAAGAVVTKDVPDYALMLGSPARQRGWVSRHGHALKMADKDGVYRCPESGFRYRVDQDGTMRCLDLNEQLPLPEVLAFGAKAYRDISPRADRIP